MLLSNSGRTYERGKPLSPDFRRLIIDEIVKLGGNIATGFFPGSITMLANKFHVSRSSIRRIWQRFCEEFTELPRVRGGGNPSKLTNDDLELIEVLKNYKGSMTLKEIYAILEEFGDCQGNTSISAISHAIKTRMVSGQRYSRKKITKVAKERFTPVNLIFTQLFMDYLSSKDPYKIKFFDEAGVKTPDVGTRLYGHSPVGDRCIEVIRKCESPNLTLNALVSLHDGAAHYNIIDGATNTVQFLNYFTEVIDIVSPYTNRPILECGDILVMDNLSSHHYEGGEILEDCLDDIGVELLYTPVYSPDLNPIEAMFSKVKTELNYDLRPLVNFDLKYAVSEAVDTITAWDVHGYYNNTSYMFV